MWQLCISYSQPRKRFSLWILTRGWYTILRPMMVFGVLKSLKLADMLFLSNRRLCGQNRPGETIWPTERCEGEHRFCASQCIFIGFTASPTDKDFHAIHAILRQWSNRWTLREYENLLAQQFKKKKRINKNFILVL